MTAGPPRLLAADSFRVRANPRTGVAEARGPDLHLDRFTRTALAAWPGEDGSALERIRAFLDEAVARIAEYGEGFPRLELRGPDDPGGDPELSCALRPLPELRDAIELRTAPGVRLDRPERKGPSIARLSELNRRLGAEALLLDGDGRVIEGATTSIVWWRDGTDDSGRCVAPPSSGTRNRVESVTEALLREAASLSEGRPAPEELARCETWAVNALHGIRLVTGIDGAPPPAPRADRLRRFREALDRRWRPLEK